MKKKFILTLGVSVLILANPLTFSYAKSELVEGRALAMAHQYIENSLGDEAWKGNNPVVSAQSKFYTDDDKKISYIEYKVSCDSTPDCGFIMMNVDGNDVSVPIASPSGNTPSEILDQGKTVSEKLYYFGPFDLYSENEVTGDVQALDPQVAVDLRNDTVVKRSSEEKKVVKEQRDTLKNRLKDAKLAAKEFKKSDEFKKQKEEIKDQILNVPKEEFSFKALDFVNADTGSSGDTGYTAPSSSNYFVNGSTTTNCGSRIPCYTQYYLLYNPPVPAAPSTCASGCAPTAMAMIFGYHDRNGKSNLISGTAIDYFTTNSPNTTIRSVVEILKTQMSTFCQFNITYSKYEGATTKSNIPLGIQYAKNNGYPNSTSVYSGTQTIANIFTKVKSEINANRPIMLLNTSHAMVGWGYNSTTNSNIVRMNMGWGNSSTLTSTSGTLYNYSNIDYNLGLMYYFNLNKTPISSYVTVLIN